MEPVKTPARWWLCARLRSFSVLRRLESNLNFLRCIHVIDLVLKYGSDINEGDWLQLLFYFIVLMGIVASVIGMSFLTMFQVLGWSFLALQCHGNVCNWNPKLIWPRLRYFWSFLLAYASFRRFHFCMDWNFPELLSFYSFLTASMFFDTKFEGYSGLFFKNACTF